MSIVMTVLGPKPANELGVTITHEHLFIDLSCYFREAQSEEAARAFAEPVTLANLYQMRRDPYGSRDNCILDDPALAAREVEIFRRAGGRTIVDVTLPDIGRDVRKLQEVSRRTGVNIVAGCGHYIVSAWPPDLVDRSEDELARELIREIREGVEDTGVRPGIIGEIGTSNPIHPVEKRMLRAAAFAQRETGLAVTVHVHPPGRRGHEVLDILTGEGVPADRIILDHIDAALAHADIDFAQGVDYIASLAGRGCYVEFDLCGNSGYFGTSEASWWLPSDRERAKAIAWLCRHGHDRQILLSQDVGHKHYLQEYGGWGYGHVLTDFSHHLKEAGVETATISRFFVDNPAKVLSADP